MKSGHDVCILNAGNMMPVAMESAALLEDQHISTRVESFHTIKPLDAATLAEVFENYDKVCVIEEHSIIGGLFSAVSEWVVLNMPQYAMKLKTISLPDHFIHHVSDQSHLRSMSGLTADNLVSTLSAK
jgi:transketolase